MSALYDSALAHPPGVAAILLLALMADAALPDAAALWRIVPYTTAGSHGRSGRTRRPRARIR